MIIQAQITGTNRGKRVYHEIELDITPERTELGFIPADGDRPAQARVFARVWVPELGRYDLHPYLIVESAVTA